MNKKLTMLSKGNAIDREQLRGKLAAIEHERWSDWQKWMHKQGVWHNIRSPHGARDYLCFGDSTIKRWELQIDTPYDLLTPDEQKSDMEQVDRYWHLIEEYVNQHTNSVLQEVNSKVDRFEVIDDSGRAYVKGSIYGSPISVELSYQDNGRTLKVFVKHIVEGMKHDNL